MKVHTKALLFSIFVFPGVGQWILKRYKSSVVMIAIAFGATVFLMFKIVSIALPIVQMVSQGHVGADVLSLRELIKKQLFESNPELMNWIVILIVVVWVVSIADIYRLKRLDSK